MNRDDECSFARIQDWRSSFILILLLAVRFINRDYMSPSRLCPSDFKFVVEGTHDLHSSNKAKDESGIMVITPDV